MFSWMLANVAGPAAAHRNRTESNGDRHNDTATTQRSFALSFAFAFAFHLRCTQRERSPSGCFGSAGSPMHTLLLPQRSLCATDRAHHEVGVGHLINGAESA